MVDVIDVTYALELPGQTVVYGRMPSESLRFFNRELSWLEFNHRVLEEAKDRSNPLLERLKFLCIVSSNLDEFFEIRVAGLKQQKQGHTAEAHGLSAGEQLRAIAARVRSQVKSQYRLWNDVLQPELEREGISFLTYPDVPARHRKYFSEYFKRQVFPVLTPLAIDPGHPFPQLLNKSLNVVVELNGKDKDLSTDLAIVQVPRILPRVVPVPGGKGRKEFVFIGNLLQHHVGSLFHGVKVRGVHQFRVTRNSDLYFDQEEVENLLSAIESELRKLNRGRAVRLEVQKDCPPEISRRLLDIFSLEKEDLYVADGPINLLRLMPVTHEINRPELKYPPLKPVRSVVVEDTHELFARLRRDDVLLHHPFESFQTVVDFIQSAADDPAVLAIKQTLYRTSSDSPIIPALIEAASEGKQVTAIVELKARFDEEANIRWARLLQEAGVAVVYGMVGLKTHCKLSMVVRQENDGLRRYVHVGTGNYHPSTARLYTDLGLLTCHPEITSEVADVFNFLTGVSRFPQMSHLLVAPFNLHEGMMARVQRETTNARAGKPSGVTVKMNALVDEEIIEALYEASSVGVPIRLLIRGVCCLRPGVPGMSENIHVRSVVGRFLEHSRIFRFENAGNPEIFIGSSDWMPRNFFRRVECCVPVHSPALRRRIDSILESYWKDDVKSRELGSAGQSVRRRPRARGWNAQEEFIREAAERVRQNFIQSTTEPAATAE